MINKKTLLRLLKKSLLYRLMNKLDRLIIDANLTHRDVSHLTGNSHSWFNDAYNNYEDIYISSFIRVLSVIKPEIDFYNKLKLNDLFDESTLIIASIIGKLSDEDERDIANFIQSDKEIFNEIKVDWMSMEYKNKLNNEEKKVVEQVKNILAEEEL